MYFPGKHTFSGPLVTLTLETPEGRGAALGMSAFGRKATFLTSLKTREFVALRTSANGQKQTFLKSIFGVFFGI